MATSFSSAVTLLATKHEFHGQGAALIKSLDGLIEAGGAASKLASSGSGDTAGLRKALGLADGRFDALERMLAARLAAVKAATKARAEPVPNPVGSKGAAWLSAVYAHGEASKPARAARDRLIAALMRYRHALSDKLGYYRVVEKTALRQAKLHARAEAYRTRVANVMAGLLRVPETPVMRFHAEALAVHVKLSRFALPKALAKACKDLAARARKEQAVLEKRIAETDAWIGEIARSVAASKLKALVELVSG